MMTKLIMGVAHADEEELNKVKKEILLYSPLKAGIELPEDYLTREQHGIITFFFNDIASHLKGAGVDVIPLENPDIWNYGQAIEVAKAVRENRIKKEDIELNLMDINSKISPYAAPEIVYGPVFFRKRYRTALKILDEAPTLEKVIELWKENNSKREAYVLEKIIGGQPDIVVIGDGHAQELKNRLPEYQYVRSY